MVASADSQEVDEGYLHNTQESDRVKGGVSDIQPVAVPARNAEHKTVDGDEVVDEGISTPRRGHPVVGESAQSGPHDGALLDGLDPEEEGEYQQKDSNGLVVIATSYGPGDVSGSNAHECGSQKTRRLGGGQLIGQPVCCESSETREARGEQDTDVPDVNGNGQEAEGMVDNAAGGHEAGIKSSSSDTAQRVPCSVVEPVPEAVESICNEVLGSSEVEPRVD